MANFAIKASFGLDNSDLKKKAREAIAIGESIKKTLKSSFNFSMAAPAKALIAGLDVAMKGVKVLAATAGIASVALIAGVHSAYDFGRSLDEMSLRTGIAAGKLAVLSQAFQDTGESAEDVGPAINKMQRFIENAAEGSGKATDTLTRLGLTVGQLQGMAPDSQFLAIGNAIDSIPDPALRAASAMAVFGRSGGGFLALFGSHGAYGRASVTLGQQARLLNENAGIFSQIAVSLSHVGVKLQGFFVGVAARLEDVLVPLLDKFEQMDLSGIGQKFGDGLIRGAEFVIGAFKNPQAFIGIATDALMFGVLSAGNVLLASLKTAKEYFQDGMIDAIQGIGDVLLAVLTKAFAVPIAYMQASIEDMLARLPVALGGTGERQDAKAHIAALDASAAKILARHTSVIPNADPTLPGTIVQSSALTDMEREEMRWIANRKKHFEAIYKGQSVEERAQGIMKGGGPLISAEGGQYTSDQIMGIGVARLKVALSRAQEQIKGVKVDDVLGAAKYGAAMKSDFTSIANQGAGTLAQITQETPMYNGKPVSARREQEMRAELGSSAANHLLYSPGYAALLDQANEKPISEAYKAELIGKYGSDAEKNMVDSRGALINQTALAEAVKQYGQGPLTALGLFGSALAATQDAGSALATGAAGQANAGAAMPVRSWWTGVGGDTALDRDRVRLGLHEGVQGGAYHLIRRGDAARAKAAELAAGKQAKEPVHIGTIDSTAAKTLAHAIGEELEVS